MIEVKNISKQYGSKRGISNFSFTVNTGEILGFLGPNGAGKTTTLNILSGYLQPDKGEVLINGINLSENPLAAKKNLGYLPEIPPLYPELQVKSFLNFVGELKGIKKSERNSRIKHVMELVKIDDVQNRLIRNLSKGYKQRIGLAQAILADPEIIILDEPTVGLDPKQITEIRSLIKKLGRMHTVILSSHILGEIGIICDRIIIINKGGIKAVDTPGNLAKSIMEHESFLIKVKAPQEKFEELVAGIKGIIKIEMIPSNEKRTEEILEFKIDNEKGVDVRDPLFYLLAENNYVIYELKSIDVNLEDVFLRFTS